MPQVGAGQQPHRPLAGLVLTPCLRRGLHHVGDGDARVCDKLLVARILLLPIALLTQMRLFFQSTQAVSILVRLVKTALPLLPGGMVEQGRKRR